MLHVRIRRLDVFTALALAVLSACGADRATSNQVDPASTSVEPGDRVKFNASAGADETVWSVRESDGGTISADGEYTAPAVEGTFHVLATRSALASTQTAEVRVRRRHVQSVAVTPQAATVSAGGSIVFDAIVTGGWDTSLTWSIAEGAAGGSITSDGTYTAPSAAGTYHVVATSVSDPNRTDTATVTVTAAAPGDPVAVTVAPASASVVAGANAQFTAAVNGTTNVGVSWSVVEGASGGSVSGTGLYSAPSAAGTYHVLVTSNADASKTATATVTVTAPPPAPILIAVSPASTTVASGGTVQLSAAVTGSPDVAVTWSVQEGAAGGTISASGLYTAPAAAGTYHAVATSHADPSKTAVSTITVTAPAPAPVAVAVSPSTATIAGGGTVQLKATVTGSTDLAVTWSVQEGAAGGTVNASGLYTAPLTAGTFHAVATSHADPTRKATATITVTAAAPTPTGVDVRTYGAVGDGVTDDTAAFTSAANTKKPLVVPATSAHYRLTGQVRVYASVTGVNNPEIRMYGADGSDGKTIFLVQDYTGTTPIVFSGLHLNGQYDGTGTAGEHSHLIAIRGSQNVTVENNVLERPYGDNVYVGAGPTNHAQSSNILIQKNQMSGPRRCTVAVISVNGLVIDGNTMAKSNNYVAAIDLEPNPNAYDVDQNVQISNNQFDVPIGNAIMLYSTTANVASGGVTVTGNTAKASRFFLKPNGTGPWQDVSITNNTYQGNGGAVALNALAQITSASNFTIDGNRISPSSGANGGDLFSGVQGLKLTNNVWNGPSTYPVKVTSCPSAIISGNTYNGVTKSLNP
ncbi:right-handed parallel beta-helix repeat-containing protein [Anaeromyxobacter oryzae]|uniref:Ig-like domain-containing protein n=1 Tax=Anaeromyxobacter oryzae TaxID=2918170 RepID=A0ABN6MPU3_9BACT|nr:right-handed parallel beta-helix repeat-containing protein [Anaeromyxobacter oryzae]BDG02290.1 hypothetical protein AMOR_12860 [Anaeromyxobacter oryzae]